MSVPSSPPKKFTIDCDNFGQFSTHQVSDSIQDESATFDSRLSFMDENNSTDMEHGNSEDWSSAESNLNFECSRNHNPISHQNHQESPKKCSDTLLLSIMILLTISFSLCEFSFGFANDSLSLVADAFHMLSDASALTVAVIAIRLGMRSETDSDIHTFGWKRAEIIGALINGVYLASVCFFILLEAIIRLFKPEPLEDPWQVLYVGVAGFAINLIGLILFFSHRSLASHGTHAGHSHSHGHSHSSNGSVNMHGVFLHVLGDAIGSLIVIGTALATIYVPFFWKIYFDPICSIIFALLILKSSVPLIRHCTSILMQSVPNTISLSDLQKKILLVQGVVSVHELHVWQMVPNYNVATAHIVVTSQQNSLQVLKDCNRIFYDSGIYRTTIQLE